MFIHSQGTRKLKTEKPLLYILPNFAPTRAHVLWQTIKADGEPKTDLYSFDGFLQSWS